jgi:hypothetical protein
VNYSVRIVLKNQNSMETESYWKQTRFELESKMETYGILIRASKDPNVKMTYKKMCRDINKVLRLKQ